MSTPRTGPRRASPDRPRMLQVRLDAPLPCVPAKACVGVWRVIPPQLTPAPMTSLGAMLQDWLRAGLEKPQAGAGTKGEQPQALAQTVANAQDSAAVDQRRPVPGQGEPALGQ